VGNLIFEGATVLPGLTITLARDATASLWTCFYVSSSDRGSVQGAAYLASFFPCRASAFDNSYNLIGKSLRKPQPISLFIRSRRNPCQSESPPLSQAQWVWNWLLGSSSTLKHRNLDQGRDRVNRCLKVLDRIQW